jgi:predicted MFS family arabinose efflux permease
LFVAGGGLVAAGFADFALIAFHFQQTALLSPAGIPILYSVAMAVAAISALLFGRWFDRNARAPIVLAFTLSALFAPFVFLGGFPAALIGMVLWGVGLGVQDSLLKAMLTAEAPIDRRSTAYGVFDTFFGTAWFLGSAVMGLLYGSTLIGLAAFSILAQLAAVPVLLLAIRRPS